MKISFNKYSPITDHKGNNFDSIVDCCEAYDISINLFKNRFWSVEKILTTPTRKYFTSPVKDHLGIAFPTIMDMCKHYSVNLSTYYYRIEKG